MCTCRVDRQDTGTRVFTFPLAPHMRITNERGICARSSELRYLDIFLGKDLC